MFRIVITKSQHDIKPNQQINITNSVKQFHSSVT